MDRINDSPENQNPNSLVNQLFLVHGVELQLISLTQGVQQKDVKDFMQDLYIRIVDKSKRYVHTDELGFIDWSSKIIKKVLKDSARKKERTIQVCSLDVAEVIQWSRENAIEGLGDNNLLGEDLRNALLSLAKQKPEQARTFILMYVGYTAREIADAFRIQINTVLSQKQYAKGWLIRMLKEYK